MWVVGYVQPLCVSAGLRTASLRSPFEWAQGYVQPLCVAAGLHTAPHCGGRLTYSRLTYSPAMWVQGYVQPLAGGGSSGQPQLHSRAGAPSQYLPARANSQGRETARPVQTPG